MDTDLAVLDATPTTTQVEVGGLAPGTTYRIAVAAVDGAGNISTTPSGPTTLTTLPA